MAIAMQQCLAGSRWIFDHLHLITVYQFNFLQAVYVHFAILKFLHQADLLLAAPGKIPSISVKR
jgi:hypothetical protein